MRSSDRVQAGFIVCAAMMLMLMVPVAAAVGTESYASAMLRAVHDTATKHSVTAVLTEDGSTEPGYLRGTVAVPAAWTYAGVQHTDSVTVSGNAARGETVRVWVGADGAAVGPPMTATDAVVAAVMVSLVLWCTALAIVSLCGMILSWSLDRRRFDEWERDWVDETSRHGGPSRGSD